MAIFVVLIIIVLFFVSFDHYCYWRRIDRFELKVYEFNAMYDFFVPRVINGDLEWPDVEEFEFNGDYYYATVQKGDVKTLYTVLKMYINEVLISYEEIGERYLASMDDETSERIEELHKAVQEKSNQIRYQAWLNGVK